MPLASRPEPLRGRVFRARDALDRGLLTRDALRSSAWRRLYRGVYADAVLPLGPGLRIAGAALLVPPSGAFSGRAAAHLLGAGELLDPAAPLEVTVPPRQSFGPVAGLVVRRFPLPPEDVRTAHGFRCTTALRTAVDIARSEPPADAVAAIDVLAHKGLVLADELAAAAAALPVGRGCRQARRVAALVDARAESQPESRVRLLLVQAGLSPVPQYTVRDGEGRFVARVDLAFPELRVAVEYDGAWHAEGAQFRRDRRRLNALVAAGWVVLHLTAGDLREPAAVVGRVRALLTRREIGEAGPRGVLATPTTPNSG